MSDFKPNAYDHPDHCKQCGDHRDEHIKGKCLYGPTHFTEWTADDVRRAAYQRLVVDPEHLRQELLAKQTPREDFLKKWMEEMAKQPPQPIIPSSYPIIPWPPIKPETENEKVDKKHDWLKTLWDKR